MAPIKQNKNKQHMWVMTCEVMDDMNQAFLFVFSFQLVKHIYHGPPA